MTCILVCTVIVDVSVSNHSNCSSAVFSACIRFYLSIRVGCKPLVQPPSCSCSLRSVHSVTHSNENMHSATHSNEKMVRPAKGAAFMTIGKLHDTQQAPALQHLSRSSSGVRCLIISSSLSLAARLMLLNRSCLVSTSSSVYMLVMMLAPLVPSCSAADSPNDSYCP